MSAMMIPGEQQNVGWFFAQFDMGQFQIANKKTLTWVVS